MKKITKSFSIFIAIFMVMNFSIAQSQKPEKPGRTENIDTFIIEKMSLFHVPGLSACIISADEVIWNNNYGFMNLPDSIPVNDSTLFNAFSIGKSLTAACVMQLWEDGLLDIDAGINNYLPFDVINHYNPDYPITSRQLLSHSSSLSDNDFFDYVTVGDPTISLEEICEGYFPEGGQYYSGGNYLNKIPGEYFLYCNFGVGLNGYLVEKINGIEFHDYATENLLSPLNMNQSAWSLNELNMENLAIGYNYYNAQFLAYEHLGHPSYPGVSLRSTALELAQFVIMMLNEGQYQGSELLQSTTIDTMLTIQNPNWNFAFGFPGLGFFKRTNYGNRTVWGHNGGGSEGYAAHLYFCKEENTGIVVMTNSDQYVDPIVECMFEYADSLVTNINPPVAKGFDITVAPNPFNEKVNIDFELPKADQVTIRIYNLVGAEIADPINHFYALGHHQSVLKVENLPSGIYFCRLQMGGEVVVKKIIKN